MGVIIHGGIAIDDGKIFSIGKEGKLPKASKTIDIRGKLVLPGLIDTHVHLRDLDLKYKEDFYSGTCAALAGGFTTVLDMPNTLPLTDSALRLREKKELVKKKSVANIGFYSCFPKREREFKKIKDVGAIGFKAYLHRPLTGLNIDDDNILFQALKTSSKLNMIVSFHAEDGSLIEGKKKEYKVFNDYALPNYPKTRPPLAEVKAIERVLSLIQPINPRIHFCHISARKSIPIILKAKRKGLHVSCEVTPHHVFLTNTLLKKFGGLAFVDPPLRSRNTCQSLWKALINENVDIVASDHAPHTLQEKKEKNIWKIPEGFPGLETTLSLLLTMVNKGGFSLYRLSEVLAQRPARIFKLRGKGIIAEGFDADLTVIDIKRKFVIDSSKFYSKAKYSPFDRRKVIGKAIQVFIGGKIVMKEGVILGKPGSGSIIHPDYKDDN